VQGGLNATLLRQARTQRVLAVSPSRVRVEFALGDVRVQITMRVPADHMPGMLLLCERQCGTETSETGPGPMVTFPMMRRPFHYNPHPGRPAGTFPDEKAA
jgi:hypothetical protein